MSGILSKREEEVLQLIMAGFTTPKIAKMLGVSFKTAETHRHHIRQKTNTHSPIDMMRWALRRDS